MIAPYHPASNGAAECSVQTFKTFLKEIIEGKEVKELNTILQRFLLTYCSTPPLPPPPPPPTHTHCQTHISPAELLFSKKLNTCFNFVKPTLTDIYYY